MHLWNTEYFPWRPVAATMDFQWYWHKTIIDTKRPKETRLKPPFHFSGTVWTNVVYLHLMAVTLVFFILFLYSRYENFLLWWLPSDFQKCFKNSCQNNTVRSYTLCHFSYLVWNRQIHLSYNWFANQVEKKYSFFRVFGPFSGKINVLSLKKNYKTMQSM